MNENPRNNLQINVNVPSYLYRHHPVSNNVSAGQQLQQLSAEHQQQQQIQQQDQTLLLQLQSQEKKEVPIAAGLVRIITKSEHNCFNTMILTKSQLTIGRDNQSDFQITSIEISRRHARIVYKDSFWYIINLNSTNGVFVNGIKVCRPIRLIDNCLVTFGPLSNSTFRYVFVENYEQFMLMQKNSTTILSTKLQQKQQQSSAPVQLSFLLGGIDITSLSTQPRNDNDDLNCKNNNKDDDIESKRNGVQQSIQSFKTQLTNGKLELNRIRKRLLSEIKYKKYQLDIMTARLTTIDRQIIQKSESLKLPDSLKTGFLNEISCSICLDIMNEPTLLNCEHTFCFNCIDNWKQRGKQHCPICRKKFFRMTKSIQFESLIRYILEHYLTEEELKERKQTLESRINEFTNNENNDDDDSYLEINEILEGLDLTLRDTLVTFLNFADFQRQPTNNNNNDSNNEILIESDDEISLLGHGNHNDNNDDNQQEEEDNGNDDSMDIDQSIIILDDDDDENSDDVHDLSITGRIRARYEEINRQRQAIAAAASTASAVGSRNIHTNRIRNRRPIGIGHHQSNNNNNNGQRWNIRPIRDRLTYNFQIRPRFRHVRNNTNIRNININHNTNNANNTSRSDESMPLA
uniref:E3 ubiquitin-protein ligase CHFR n=1 Tax=Dermatophagoides pteronyssinus TaxID=6956 RepID=A0A6P6XPC6_DERPT|nr:myb-like protein D [Dermatophagoides pteronyssinus]